MKTTRLIEQSFATMARYKLRTGFVMLGTFIGVAALVFVVSVGKAAEQKILSTVQRLFSASSIFVTSGGNLIGGPHGGARMTLDDIQAVVTAIPAVAEWDPIQMLDPAQVRRGEATATVRVVGQSERAERVWDRAVVRGEYFDAAEVAHSARVALIGTSAQRALFAGDDCLGGEILIGGVSFRVVGVLESMGTDVHGFDRDNEIVVPISTLMRRVLNTDTIRGAKVVLRDPNQIGAAAAQIARILRDRHAIAPGQIDDFTIITALDAERLVGKVRQVLFVFLPIVAAIALLASGVVSASLLLLSMSERIAEIGLRRAVGARPRDIALQFLSEAMVTAASGGAAGLLAGGAGSLLLAEKLALASCFSWPAAVLALVLAVLIGLAAGVIPARRAARLDPVEALR